MYKAKNKNGPKLFLDHEKQHILKHFVGYLHELMVTSLSLITCI